MKSSISNFLTFGMVKKCYQCSVPNTNIIWEEFSACLFSDLFTQYSPAPIKSVILQSREIYRNSFWTDPQIQLRWSYFVGTYLQKCYYFRTYSRGTHRPVSRIDPVWAKFYNTTSFWNHMLDFIGGLCSYFNSKKVF